MIIIIIITTGIIVVCFFNILLPQKERIILHEFLAYTRYQVYQTALATKQQNIPGT